MRNLVLALVVLFSMPAFAGEVLVLTTATRVDPSPASRRRAVEIQNLGPNPIYCQLKNSTNLATTKARRLNTGEAWYLDGLSSSVPVYCIAGTANQATGAATIVTEVL